ncbi:Six-hairpin glycosidase-like protein [Biscogniauxia marginata]|nr:Six-hairpin glycosidase-like protein [Biscogniauxia marginata]
MFLLAIFALPVLIVKAQVNSKPWEKYVLSPASRSPRPTSVHSISGPVVISSDQYGHTLALNNGSVVSMDFGLEVGGFVSFNVQGQSITPVSLAFSESALFAGSISDDTGSVYTSDWDKALEVSVEPDSSGEAFYQTTKEQFRGGFRFLTFNALADVVVSNISCHIGFAPNMPNLRSSSSYFYSANSEGELYNRIYYAGAYTVQTNMAPDNTGRWLPQVNPGWAYNATIGPYTPALVDGAKRDRAVWPGDLGIAGEAAVLAYGPAGREVLRNSLEILFHYQNTTGRVPDIFPYAGPSTRNFNRGALSDTYHAWALISIYGYAMNSGDTSWLSRYWSNITRGVDFIVNNLDETTGLENQTRPNDWGRLNSGGYSASLNALNYHVLLSMASISKDSSQAAIWRRTAEILKNKFNLLLWDACKGMYKDNTDSDVYPQDGNALALLYNLTTSVNQAASVSAGLEENWNSIGPVSPELPDTISPFISGVELLAHLKVGETDRAFELMRRLWGYLLNDTKFTGSTFAEGLASNGSLYYRSATGYNYDPAYTSLAHSWSSAPTTALVTGVVGIDITGIGGSAWELRPQLGNLTHASAGFDTGHGRFEVSIEVVEEELYTINVTAPANSTGKLFLPANCRRLELTQSYEGPKIIVEAS